MASKRMDLKQSCFFVLSGLSNPLGKVMALEMCRRFKSGSLALLIEKDEELLQEVKKQIEELNSEIEVMCCTLSSWQHVNRQLFHEILNKALESFMEEKFDLAFILHNEGTLATRDLMEPQDMPTWLQYIQEHVYAPIALNQEFKMHPLLKDTQKLLVNITSSVPVQPIFYSSVHGSCLKARNMYFRSLAFEEGSARLAVLSYGAGIFETHEPQADINNNTVDLMDLRVNPKLLKIPRVKPCQSALKLINILEEISFISGHDVDYYDTFNL